VNRNRKRAEERKEKGSKADTKKVKPTQMEEGRAEIEKYS